MEVNGYRVAPEADLRGAMLVGAWLEDVDLSGADLTDADLSGAFLKGANLRSARLCNANLCRANLAGTNLTGADLSGARYDDDTNLLGAVFDSTAFASAVWVAPVIRVEPDPGYALPLAPLLSVFHVDYCSLDDLEEFLNYGATCGWKLVSIHSDVEGGVEGYFEADGGSVTGSTETHFVIVWTTESNRSAEASDRGE